MVDWCIFQLAAHSENYRTFCCGPFKTAPVKMELHLPQSGYVPGQRIPVTVVVINNSGVSVSELRLSLVMLIRYFSITPEHSRVDRIVIGKVQGDSVLKRSTVSLAIDMEVPSTPPTCLNVCNLIQIAYQLEVEALIKSLQEHQLITMPITIGTWPLALKTSSGKDVVLQQPPRRSARYESQADELPMVTALENQLNSQDISKLFKYSYQSITVEYLISTPKLCPNLWSRSTRYAATSTRRSCMPSELTNLHPYILFMTFQVLPPLFRTTVTSIKAFKRKLESAGIVFGKARYFDFVFKYKLSIVEVLLRL